MGPQTREIVEQIQEEYGYTLEELRQRHKREPQRVRAKKALIQRLYALRPEGYHVPFTAPWIGRFLRLDHTTVLYHLGRTKRQPPEMQGALHGS